MLSKQGKISTTFENASLQQAITKLQELKERARDFVVPIHRMQMNESGVIHVDSVTGSTHFQMRQLGININPERLAITPNDIANQQIANRFDIPKKYWDKMTGTNPELAAENFNSWIKHELAEKGSKKSRRMLVRTYMDDPGGNIGTLRALLSDRFFVYDNLDLLAVALKSVEKANDEQGLNLQVEKCDLSESRIYIRFICPDIELQAKEALQNYIDPDGGSNGGTGSGTGIVTGFVLSNSETGQGALFASPRVLINACANGMVWHDEGFRRTHLGAKLNEGEMMWSNRTKAANVLVIENQLRDVIKKFVSRDFLAQRMADIEQMAQTKLEHPTECFSNMCNAIGITEEEKAGIFDKYLMQGGPKNNVFAVAQSITSFAHTCTADRRFELEKASTELLPLVEKCDIAK